MVMEIASTTETWFYKEDIYSRLSFFPLRGKNLDVTQITTNN